MNDVGQISAFLQRIEAFNETAAYEVEDFIGRDSVSGLAKEYSENLQKRKVDLGFNFFAVISDRYHQENLHSDILRAFLDPQGKHQEGDIYLHLFLEFLISHGANIDLSHYSHAKVAREQGRIDLLIKDDATQRAIIIENKINNAGDQPHQLLRYLEWVRKGYTCDAIIYLRLNGYAGPDMTGWTIEEGEQVKTLLKVVCAYDGTEQEQDLLTGWIRKCEKASQTPDAQLILRQYGKLITKLGAHVMNKQLMDKFYRMIVEGDNFENALSVTAMFNDLVLYRVERLMDTLRNDLTPFVYINNYQDSVAYLHGLRWNEAHFGLDVFVHQKSYTLTFWDRDDREGKGQKGHARTVLQKMGCLDDFTCNDGNFRSKRSFAFPSGESDLLEYIAAFKKKLGEATKQPN